MSHIDFLQLNKFSSLHNNHNIFFCKTDYILDDFKFISTLDHEVILITGNSDYAITDELVNIAPKNIKRWYCQNAISNHSIINPIPIGLENKLGSYRPNHGTAYLQRVTEKENIISNLEDKQPTKFIYANYDICTNKSHRQSLTNKIYRIKHITYRDPNLTLMEFFNEIIDHKMVLCPVGNGVDTHRLWETIYCNRIPITCKVGNYKIYNLYEQLPIIILNSFSELLDEEHITNLYNKAISKKFNTDLLNYEYWKNIIVANNHA